jgi:hypothetical protein
MKVALINPPHIFARSWIFEAASLPLGLLYLAASLKQLEHISSEKLIRLRSKACLTFYLTIVLYLPFKVLSSIINILKSKEVLKAERTLIVMSKITKLKIKGSF